MEPGKKSYSICSYTLFILTVAHCIGISMMKNPGETSYWYYYNGTDDNTWITFKLQSHYFWPESVLIYIYIYTHTHRFPYFFPCVRVFGKLTRKWSARGKRQWWLKLASGGGHQWISHAFHARQEHQSCHFAHTPMPPTTSSQQVINWSPHLGSSHTK